MPDENWQVPKKDFNWDFKCKFLRCNRHGDFSPKANVSLFRNSFCIDRRGNFMIFFPPPRLGYDLLFIVLSWNLSQIYFCNFYVFEITMIVYLRNARCDIFQTLHSPRLTNDRFIKIVVYNQFFSFHFCSQKTIQLPSDDIDELHE